MIKAMAALEEKLFSLFTIKGFFQLVKQSKYLLLFAVLIVLVSYGYEIFGFSLRIDSEFSAETAGAKEAWLAQGRWGMYFLNCYLLPDVVMPVIPVLLAVVGLTMGAYFFLMSLAEKTELPHFLALAVIVACPVYYFVNYFTTLGYGIGVGFVCAGLANYLLIKKEHVSLTWVLILYTFTIGIYQAFLPVLAVMFGVAMLNKMLEEKGVSKAFFEKCFYFVFILCASYFLYEVVKNHLLSVNSIKFDESYLSNFNKFELTSDFLSRSIAQSYASITKYYFGDGSIYLYDIHAMRWLFWLSLLVCAASSIVGVRGLFAPLLALLLLALVLVAPAAMLVMNGGEMPPRTQLSMPIVFAGLVFLAAKLPSRSIKAALVLLVIVCVYKFAVVLNRYSFANALQWEADKVYSTLLVADIQRHWDSFPKKSIHGSYPLEIVGVHYDRESVLMVNRDVIGTSFYHWGAGDIYRIVALLKSMGITDYRAPEIEQRIKVIPAVSAMPNWPAAGSIKFVNGVVVVKLDEYNPNQLQKICRGKWERPECAAVKK